ncbi:hypothetical protein M9H77_33744 [Catharanthus roseus]|uniref:Uncharacterized protein n=1 Tax=Catharanthus roseus TaxID=4058 RepID=A0ACB9ZK34_CATRO|nr:hypothetical protein M9H77_33744 [Catharanthus roseus]
MWARVTLCRALFSPTRHNALDPFPLHYSPPLLIIHLVKKGHNRGSISSMQEAAAFIGFLHQRYLSVLPHIQQALPQECQDKRAAELLDEYLRLLDTCSTTRDLFSQTKQSIHQLLSALRRKDRDDLSRYLTSRKNSKKIIQKALSELRSIRSCRNLEHVKASLNSYYDHQTGWSLVSKLMNTRESKQEKEIKAKQLEKVDSSLHFLKDDLEQVEAVQNQLRNILSSIETVEDDLECLFRRLIKIRVFLLNILNH